MPTTSSAGRSLGPIGRGEPVRPTWVRPRKPWIAPPPKSPMTGSPERGPNPLPTPSGILAHRAAVLCPPAAERAATSPSPTSCAPASAPGTEGLARFVIRAQRHTLGRRPKLYAFRHHHRRPLPARLPLPRCRISEPCWCSPTPCRRASPEMVVPTLVAGAIMVAAMVGAGCPDVRVPTAGVAPRHRQRARAGWGLCAA